MQLHLDFLLIYSHRQILHPTLVTMNSISSILLVCALAAVSLAQSSGGGSKQPATDILQCVSCNSAIVGQEWCASTKGVEDNKAKASVSCNNSPVAGEVVVGCRKTLQVSGPWFT